MNIIGTEGGEEGRRGVICGGRLAAVMRAVRTRSRADRYALTSIFTARSIAIEHDGVGIIRVHKMLRKL